MSMTIPVAHDFICPWCWIGLSQAKRLSEEFGVQFDWLGYELMPESLPWPEPKPREEADPRKPETPSRLDLAYAAEGMVPPKAKRPKHMRSHNALEAVEFAKKVGAQDALVERLYKALWEDGAEINSIEVLSKLADGLLDVPAMVQAVEECRFANQIVPFDDEAYDRGVFNVPTFFIGGQRYAEQPYTVLRQAILKEMK